MLNKLVNLLLVAVLAFTTVPVKAQKNELAVAVLSADHGQIAAYTTWFNRFELSNPDVSLKLDFYSDENYKNQIQTWLKNGSYDLLYWQAGSRLERLVEKNWLQPITNILKAEEISRSIPSGIVNELTFENELYALPFSQYAWGIYYNIEIFETLDLTPPQTWEQLIAISEHLKQQNFVPFIQTTHETWPVLAWVDYVSLIVGGRELRDKLTTGKLLTPEEKNAMVQHMQALLESNFFLTPTYDWRWQQTLPTIARKQAAMTLTGQFAESIIAPQWSDKIGYFPFPEMKEMDIEMTPMEVFVVPRSTKKQKLVSLFLRYLLRPNVQKNLALDLGWLPINLQTLDNASINSRKQTINTQLKAVQQRIQYFDRDASPEVAEHLASGIITSIRDNNVSAFAEALNSMGN